MITIIAAGFQYLKAAVDHTGKIVAWKDTSSRMAKSTNSSTTAGFNAGEFPAGYIENFLVQASTMPLGLETGALRAPGSNRIAWVMPSFIDDWRTPPAKIWQLERSLSVLRRDPSKSDRHPVGIVIASKSEL